MTSTTTPVMETSTTMEPSINSGSVIASSSSSARTSNTLRGDFSEGDALPLEGNSEGHDERRVEASALSAAAGPIPETMIQVTIIEMVEAKIHPRDPFLFMMPKQLHRYYQPLPTLLRLMSVMLASWLAALTTWKRLAWWQPLSILRGIRAAPTTGEVAAFIRKSLTWTLLAQAMLQEGLGPPSSVSMQQLLHRYFLPSSLSRYREIAVPPS